MALTIGTAASRKANPAVDETPVGRAARISSRARPAAGRWSRLPFVNRLPRNRMSSINAVGGNSPVQKVVTNPIQKQLPADAAAKPTLTDRVELSGIGAMLKTLKAGGDFRADKVAEIKSQIEAGKYADDDHK